MTRRALLAGVCGAAGARGQREGEMAPGFRLRVVDGTWVELGAMRGSVVLVNFWATWCGPCRKEMPALNRIAREFQGRGVRVVGVAVDESGWRVVRPFVAQYGITYPVAVADRETKRAYREGIKVLPCTVVVDGEGRVMARLNTALEEEQLRALCLEALRREGG